MKKIVRLAVGVYLLFSLAIILPFIGNLQLRRQYLGILSHFYSKVTPPDVVFLGDSITAGGDWYRRRLGSPLGTINLGENGLMIYQISSRLPTAMKYHPHYLSVMGGVNDVYSPYFDRDKSILQWQTLIESAIQGPESSHPHLILTLPPFTADQKASSELAAINAAVRDFSIRKKIDVVDLNPVLAPKGTLLPQFTVDGVHLNEAAYQIWADSLRLLMREQHE